MACSLTSPALAAATTAGMPPATVIITTKNRKGDLRKAIDSTLMQTVPVEILVFDDGSTDGTAQMVHQHYPQVRLHRVEESLGINRARNQAIQLASAPIVITIDDDCVFSSPDIIRRTLSELDLPRIGAVAIPCIHVYIDPHDRGATPPNEDVYVCAEFRGGANALRRDLFLTLGQYRGFFYRQGEEGDYCLRLLDAGYVVRAGRADAILHYHSPIRDNTERFYYQSRNNVLYAWYNVPIPYLLPHLLATIYNSLRTGFRAGHFRVSLRGTIAGLRDMFLEYARRAPVSRQAYRLMRRLKRRGLLSLQTIESELPSIRFPTNG
ncbi:MAG TPA: glycosyltransferase family A protein [Tepidisphaeraceae bacterium]|nr:glycosyltransferase family A protein [Tepidisphaeraceae bacterium]